MFSGGSGSNLTKSECEQRISSMLMDEKEVFDFPDTETERTDLVLGDINMLKAMLSKPLKGNLPWNYFKN